MDQQSATNNRHNNDNNSSNIDINDPQQSTPPPRKFLWFVPLKAHVHPIRFFFFLFSVFVSLSVIVYFAAAQSWTLSSILHVTEDAGDVTGSLSTYSEVTSIIFVVTWGVMSDHIQKRTIISISLAIIGIIFIAYPYAPNVYPTLLILRLIYSIGTAGTTCMMASMFIEIVHAERAGLVSGLIGTCSGLGAIFAAFVLFSVPTEMAHLGTSLRDPNLIVYAYAAIGATTIAIGIILWFLMPKRPPPEANVIPAKNTRERVWKNLWYGVKAAKDPRIALGYISSFFARADEVIITHFITLWIQQYYIDEGRCFVGQYCPYAPSSSRSQVGIAQTVALVVAPFFGIASEFNRDLGLVAAGVIGVAGCIPFAFSIDPTSSQSLAFIILLAMGQYGMIVSGMALIARDRIPPEFRGGVAGMYSLSGVIGIMIISKVGGVLFDKWMKGAPFLLLGIGHGLIALLALIHFIYMVVQKYIYGQKDVKLLYS
ncbi:major facilitator superfamily domain-containing protein [Phascolomyces articulosus]|uniref:Major facilitator superfamily domain-containing protein n=1 Tax=Phascolomyces articulosus TaxID=60185 RepID=A0AAD5P9Q0_9FUNG|nr:major facilitator superfamily domain-containing protein [Phascolomyces articulosus]